MSECVHHWIIDPPDGPTSMGICRFCGEERRFRNSADYTREDGRVALSLDGDFQRSERQDAVLVGDQVPVAFADVRPSLTDT